MNFCVYKRPLFLSLLLLIATITLFYHPQPSSKDVSRFISKNAVYVVGRVESFAVEKPSSYNVRVKVKQVNGEPATGILYLRSAQKSPAWKEIIAFTGVLKEPYGIALLGNFDWRNYLSYKNVFTETRVEDYKVLKPSAWLYRMISALRGSILENFETHFPKEQAQIGGGILLGERGDLAPELFASFQDSGAIHLLVASGGNVGFVTLLTMAACGIFSLSRKKSLLISLGIAGIYTLLAGADAPLLRAYFMTVCAVMGYLFKRNSGIFQGLVLSCFLLLLFHPTALFETGFQMSFLATFAIVLVVNNYQIPNKWPSWIRFFVQIFLATLATQLVLLPIFTNVFYKVSLAGLAANMVLVPLASGLLGLSFAYYVFELLHLGFILYFPTLWGLRIFAGLVRFFASLPFASLTISAWGPCLIIAYYIGLFLIFHLPCPWLSRKCWVTGIAVIVLLLAVHFWWERKTTRIYLLNEWHKNVVLVKMPTKTFVVGNEISPEKIKAALYKIGRSRVDAQFVLRPKDEKDSLANWVPVTQEIVPFTSSVWPGERWQFDSLTVTLRWGLYPEENGRLTERRGYTGSKEDVVSYCFEEKKIYFCVGADGRFVATIDKQVFSKRNKTVSLKI